MARRRLAGSFSGSRALTMLRLAPLDAAPIDVLCELFNDARVRKHMPLARAVVDSDWVHDWITGKQQLWPDASFGPWSVWHADDCIGWAGVQPNDESTNELAVVLRHESWGLGTDVARLVMDRWNELGDTRPVLIFLPRSRGVGALQRRYGWERLADSTVDGITFATFRLQ